MSNRFDKHPLLTGITIALVLVLLGDVILGTFCYRCDPRLVRTGLANERSYRRSDKRYHHGLIPLMSVDSALWGSVFYRVRTNSLGFKDAEPRMIAAASEKPRVVIIGDSFTEGVGVEFDSTTAGRLTARARPSGVDVLNAGVVSYSPVIYYRKMKDLIERLALRVDEVVVFIDASDIQDEKFYYLDEHGNVQGHSPGGWEDPEHGTLSAMLMRIKTFLRTHSFAVYRALSVVAHPIRTISELRSMEDTAYPVPSCAAPIEEGDPRCRVGWTSNDPAIMDKFGNVGLANAKRHMSDLAVLLKQRGIPMTIVVYPWPYQVAWNERHSLQSTTWRDWANDQHVAFVDLTPAFFAQVDSTSVDAVIKRDFLAGDVHWNAHGHGVVEREFTSSYCGVHGDSASARQPLASAICGARR